MGTSKMSKKDFHNQVLQMYSNEHRDEADKLSASTSIVVMNIRISETNISEYPRVNN